MIAISRRYQESVFIFGDLMGIISDAIYQMAKNHKTSAESMQQQQNRPFSCGQCGVKHVQNIEPIIFDQDFMFTHWINKVPFFSMFGEQPQLWHNFNNTFWVMPRNNHDNKTKITTSWNKRKKKSIFSKPEVFGKCIRLMYTVCMQVSCQYVFILLLTILDAMEQKGEDRIGHTHTHIMKSLCEKI